VTSTKVVVPTGVGGGGMGDGVAVGIGAATIPAGSGPPEPPPHAVTMHKIVRSKSNHNTDKISSPVNFVELRSIAKIYWIVVRPFLSRWRSNVWWLLSVWTCLLLLLPLSG